MTAMLQLCWPASAQRILENPFQQAHSTHRATTWSPTKRGAKRSTTLGSTSDT